jgi:flagellar protein FliO/FliZ
MDLDLYLRFVLALVFVLALIALCAWAARRFGLLGKLAPPVGKSRRLSVVEVAPLDARHKLVLFRRDDTEHLVLMGPGANLLVEGSIRSGSESASPLARAQEAS